MSWDEIGAGDWGVPGFANASESYDWFGRQPCQDVEYDVVWEIILPSSEDRKFSRLWHFSAKDWTERDTAMRDCWVLDFVSMIFWLIFYFIFIGSFVFLLNNFWAHFVNYGPSIREILPCRKVWALCLKRSIVGSG